MIIGTLIIFVIEVAAFACAFIIFIIIKMSSGYTQSSQSRRVPANSAKLNEAQAANIYIGDDHGKSKAPKELRRRKK